MPNGTSEEMKIILTTAEALYNIRFTLPFDIFPKYEFERACEKYNLDRESRQLIAAKVLPEFLGADIASRTGLSTRHAETENTNYKLSLATKQLILTYLDGTERIAELIETLPEENKGLLIDTLINFLQAKIQKEEAATPIVRNLFMGVALFSASQLASIFTAPWTIPFSMFCKIFAVFHASYAFYLAYVVGGGINENDFIDPQHHNLNALNELITYRNEQVGVQEVIDAGPSLAAYDAVSQLKEHEPSQYSNSIASAFFSSMRTSEAAANDENQAKQMQGDDTVNVIRR